MVTKTIFLSKCSDSLSNYFTEIGTKVTIDVMSKLKLKELQDSDTVPPNIVDLCITTLYERVKMLKGNDKASQFLKEIEGNN